MTGRDTCTAGAEGPWAVVVTVRQKEEERG